jgi:CRP-like cAMP-binding protein
MVSAHFGIRSELATRLRIAVFGEGRAEMSTAIAEHGRRRSEDVLGRFSPSVAAAWQDGPMASCPPQVTEALLEGADEITVRRGEIFYRGAAHVETVILALIADGLVRTFTQAENGRRATIRYSGPGDLVGTPALVFARLGDERSGERWRAWGGHNIHGEALWDAVVLKLSPPRFLQLAATEVSVASALATLLAQSVVETEQILADGLFLSIRARVARHLMDLARWEDGTLIVHASHQEIAGAIGSVREVVSRTLVGMRAEGVVDRRGPQTVLLDPARLHEIASAG